MCPDNGPKNTHIKFQKDRSMGTLSKIKGTERLDERNKEEFLSPIWRKFKDT